MSACDHPMGERLSWRVQIGATERPRAIEWCSECGSLRALEGTYMYPWRQPGRTTHAHVVSELKIGKRPTVSATPETEGQRICDEGLTAMNEAALNVYAVALYYDCRATQVSIGALRLTPQEAHAVLLLALSKVQAQLGGLDFLE